MKIVTSEIFPYSNEKITIKIMHYWRKKKKTKKKCKVSFWQVQIHLSATKPVSIQEQAQPYWYFAPFCLKQHESNRTAWANLLQKGTQTPLIAVGEAVLDHKNVGRFQAVARKIFQTKLPWKMDYQSYVFLCLYLEFEVCYALVSLI